MYQVLVKRFDKTLPFPERKTAGAVAYDLGARLETTIEAHSFGLIPLNVAIKFPAGYWILMAARGSTHKLGLLMANGIGIFDEDFCGDGDEYQFPAYNPTDQAVTITRGQRIAQIMILARPEIELLEVESLDAPNRGAFGTTGK